MVDEFPVPDLPDGGEDGKKVPTGRDKQDSKVEGRKQIVHAYLQQHEQHRLTH